MSDIERFLESEDSPEAVRGLLVAYTKQSTRALARLRKNEAEGAAIRASIGVINSKLQAVKNHADKIHAKNMRPVTEALDGATSVDVDLTLTQTVDIEGTVQT